MSREAVRAFYKRYPYPPPHDDLNAYRRRWDDQRRRADSYLFFPHEPYRDDRSILVAGCGTSQAAHYAVRWPNARVVGIDTSATSIAHTLELKRKHRLDNLEARELAVEDARELGKSFEHIVCTGVLHHLADPDAGLRALRDVLAQNGTIHLMLYAPYGRAGVYMLQDYCRRLGIGPTDDGIRDLATSLKALPNEHPIVPLLRNAPDFATTAGIADALLHPQDRAYSVPELYTFLEGAGLHFARWVRQAPYLPYCGAVAATPHAPKLRALPPREQHAAIELFRGTMVRHSLIASHSATPAIDFESADAPAYVPMKLPDALVVREQLPAGATAVLINPNHTFTDLYLPIDAQADALLAAVNGSRTIAQIASSGTLEAARAFFKQLWYWDQVVVATSRRSP